MQFVVSNISQDEIKILENEGFNYFLMNENTAVIESDMLYYTMALRALRRYKLKDLNKIAAKYNELAKDCTIVEDTKHRGIYVYKNQARRKEMS